MSNFVVIPNKKENIESILNKNIKGIIIGVKNLSIYPLELSIEDIIDIANNTDKEIIIAMNKMIHNKDLKIVRKTLEKVKNSPVGVGFDALKEKDNVL